jgi:DNA-binding transcriptional LysR family regulator
MDSLTDYRALVAVVDAGSIGAAAKAMRLPKSTLSRAMTRLEQRLQTPLFERSGAKVVPTSAGVTLTRRARRALELLAQGEEEARLEHIGASGPLRVSVPSNAGDRFHTELVLRTLRALPDISLEIEATDRFANLVDEQVDVVVRAGRVGSGDWISATLAEARWGLYGRAGDRHPQHIDELAQAHLLLVSIGGAPFWPWKDPPLPRERVRLASNNFRAVAAAAADGQGLAVVTRAIAAGLEPVLPQLTVPAVPLLVMWPPSRQGDPRVRVFVDVVKGLFARDLGD